MPHTTVRPGGLDEAARDALVDELFEIHEQVFSGVDRATFARYVVEAPAARETTIRVFRDDDGRAEGYAAVHFFHLAFRGAPAVVMRGEVGLRRGARGRSASMPFLLSTFLDHWLRHRPRRMFFMACPVHPASYTKVVRASDHVWPRPFEPVPADVQALMVELAEAFGLEAVDPARPLVRAVGWTTRQNELEERYWRRCDKPEARYYLAMNPTYTEGDGLLVLARASRHTVADVARVAGRVGRATVERGLRRLRPAARPRVISSAQVADALGRTELLAGLDRDDVAVLAAGATRQQVPAGAWLFRQGDPGDGLYVVLSGSAFVVVEDAPAGDDVDDGGRMLDQLAPGDVVGEIALVTGEPRMAGVRAATRLTVLRIDGAALDELVRARPAVAEALWERIALLRFLAFVAELPVGDAMDVEARERWFAKGHPGPPGADAADAWTFLLEGRAEVDGPAGPAYVSWPALLPVDDVAGVRPVGAARTWVLPARP